MLRLPGAELWPADSAVTFPCSLDSRAELELGDGSGQRDPGGPPKTDQGQASHGCPMCLQAKLGNSSVSPNVGHLVLKYLCPAVQAVLEDGLKAFVLDVIIGQRKNMPWSVVEASTQLGGY